MSDHLIPFLIENRGVRGFASEIQSGIADMFGWRHYSPDVSRQLGHALAATPLLAADVRDEGRFNIQFKGHGALQMLVTQIDEQLNLRGMAKSVEGAAGDFSALMQGGLLACLVEPRSGAERHQAIVEIRGDSLAAALEGYFEQSAQLPTLIRLGARTDRFAGLLLQRQPEGIGLDADNWAHVQALFATLSEAELLDTDPLTLLHRLFAQDQVRVFPARPLRLVCRCSHAGISAMLLALGEDDLRQVLTERGEIEVTCEFCGKTYSYSDIEVGQLLAAASSSGKGETRQ